MNHIKKLRRCAHCNQKPDLYTLTPVEINSGFVITVVCSDSWCSERPSVGGPTLKGAITAWNEKMKEKCNEPKTRISSGEQPKPFTGLQFPAEKVPDYETEATIGKDPGGDIDLPSW